MSSWPTLTISILPDPLKGGLCFYARYILMTTQESYILGKLLTKAITRVTFKGCSDHLDSQNSLLGDQGEGVGDLGGTFCYNSRQITLTSKITYFLRALLQSYPPGVPCPHWKSYWPEVYCCLYLMGPRILPRTPRLHSPNLPYSKGIGSLAAASPVLKVV